MFVLVQNNRWFWVLLIIDLCIALPLGCVFARLLEPWAQNSPRRGGRAGKDLPDYLHRCLYELAEGLIMSALIIVTMATLYAGGATDQIQAWNVVIAALILVGAAAAAVRLNRAFAQDAANEQSVIAQTAIAERNNKLALKQAELKIVEETKRAESESAFDIQNEIQRKEIEIRTQEANIAAREKDKADPAYTKFVKAYQSDAVKQFIAEKYKGTIEPAWE